MQTSQALRTQPAVSHRCDLLAAVAQGKGSAPAFERVALEFLGTSEIARAG